MTTPDKNFYRAGILVRILETRNDYPPVAEGQPPRYIAAGDISLFSVDDAERLVALGRIRYYEDEPRMEQNDDKRNLQTPG